MVFGKTLRQALNFTKSDFLRSGDTDAAVPEQVQILCRLSHGLRCARSSGLGLPIAQCGQRD
jgi:hypothetical protein